MRLLRARAGIVAAEFAICASLLIVVLMFVLEVGLMSWTKVALQAAAANAARCGAVGSPSCTSLPAYTVTTVETWLFPSAVLAADVTVQTAASCNGAAGKYTIVTVTSTGWASKLPTVLPGPLTAPALSATSCYLSSL